MDIAKAKKELLKCVGTKCPVCQETLEDATKFTGWCGHTVCIQCFRNQPKRVSTGTPIPYDAKCRVCGTLVTPSSALAVSYDHELLELQCRPPMTREALSRKLLAPVYDGNDEDISENDQDVVRKMKQFALQFLQFNRKDSRWGRFCSHWPCPPIPKGICGAEALMYWHCLVQDFLGSSENVVKFSTAWFYIWRAAQGTRITYECHGAGHEDHEWRANNIKAGIDVPLFKVVEKALELLKYTEKERLEICAVRVNGQWFESDTRIIPSLIKMCNDKPVELVLERGYSSFSSSQAIECRCVMVPWGTKGTQQEESDSDEDMPGLE